MNHAYRMIAHGDERNSISDIAKGLGFSHMSQFATDYFKLFEELPSDTRAVKSINVTHSKQELRVN